MGGNITLILRFLVFHMILSLYIHTCLAFVPVVTCLAWCLLYPCFKLHSCHISRRETKSHGFSAVLKSHAVGIVSHGKWNDLPFCCYSVIPSAKTAIRPIFKWPGCYSHLQCTGVLKECRCSQVIRQLLSNYYCQNRSVHYVIVCVSSDNRPVDIFCCDP